ncbi:zinc ribbon domain-containing protein [uncultured Eubacterium sp.]|uniref:zinc ribbon domain-containing protein n=1 Tax=uncultured Eubacterium sp. TaxID=165185 RepID=UPI0034141A0E
MIIAKIFSVYFSVLYPYYEYVCNSFHRYGKEHCTPHRIRESVLDKIIYDELVA